MDVINKINFRPLKLSDRNMMLERTSKGTTAGCCYSFGTVFIWQDTYAIEIADYKGFLIMRGKDDLGDYYVYPSGTGDVKEVLDEIMDECHISKKMFRLSQLLPENKEELSELYPDKFDFFYDRDDAEYVYSVENMINLPGKKFHGKKSHVNAFFRNHEKISCDPITKDNIHLCIDIEKAWLGEREDDFGELAGEYKAIKLAIENYDELDFSGAILFADGKAVAFTMGEPLKNNTFCTHFEKTLPDYRDAYPVINNGFTKLMLSTYEYVNREEDTGDEGLRQAKLSYHPVHLIDKYSAVLKDCPNRKYRIGDEDIPELKSLWKTVFGDEDSVIDCFLKNVMDKNKVFAYREDGRIVSAFYMLESDLVIGDVSHRSLYLYAAATLPEYRKKGCMSTLLDYAKELYSSIGYHSIFLYPANEKLYDYYKKFGFETAFKDRFTFISNDEIKEYGGSYCFRTSLDYAEMRNNMMTLSYAGFGDKYIEFSEYCNKEYGGFSYGYYFDDEDKVYIIGNTDEDGTVHITEAFSLAGNAEHELNAIAYIPSKNGYVLKTPTDIMVKDFGSEIKNSGMILLLDKKENIGDTVIYMGQPCE